MNKFVADPWPETMKVSFTEETNAQKIGKAYSLLQFLAEMWLKGPCEAGVRIAHRTATSTIANIMQGFLLANPSFGKEFCHSGGKDREEKHWVGAPSTTK